MNIVDRIELKIRAWNNTHVRKPDVIYVGVSEANELDRLEDTFMLKYKGMEVVAVNRASWLDIGRHL